MLNVDRTLYHQDQWRLYTLNSYECL